MKVPEDVDTAECCREYNDEGDNGEQDVSKRRGGRSWGRTTTQKRGRRHCVGDEARNSNSCGKRGGGYMGNLVLKVVV